MTYDMTPLRRPILIRDFNASLLYLRAWIGLAHRTETLTKLAKPCKAHLPTSPSPRRCLRQPLLSSGLQIHRKINQDHQGSGLQASLGSHSILRNDLRTLCRALMQAHLRSGHHPFGGLPTPRMNTKSAAPALGELVTQRGKQRVVAPLRLTNKTYHEPSACCSAY